MKVLRAIVAIACCLALSAFAQMESWKKGDKMPDFSAKAADGKTYTLKEAVKGGGAVLYFIKTHCPTNDQALPYYIRIAAAYKGAKVPFLGVINAGEDDYKEWLGTNKLTFPVLFDPDMKLIRAWKAQRSPWVIMVDKSGKVVKEWPGYSKAYLKELGALIAKASKKPEKNCDFTGAPTNPRFG